MSDHYEEFVEESFEVVAVSGGARRVEPPRDAKNGWASTVFLGNFTEAPRFLPFHRMSEDGLESIEEGKLALAKLVREVKQNDPVYQALIYDYLAAAERASNVLIVSALTRGEVPLSKRQLQDFGVNNTTIAHLNFRQTEDLQSAQTLSERLSSFEVEIAKKLTLALNLSPVALDDLSVEKQEQLLRTWVFLRILSGKERNIRRFAGLLVRCEYLHQAYTANAKGSKLEAYIKQTLEEMGPLYALVLEGLSEIEHPFQTEPEPISVSQFVTPPVEAPEHVIPLLFQARHVLESLSELHSQSVSLLCEVTRGVEARLL